MRNKCREKEQREPFLSAAGKPDDAIKAYTDGIDAARKQLELQANSGSAKVGLGQMLNAEGNLLVQQKKYEDAAAIFAQAAETSAYPAMPYFNLCATYYNLRHFQDALAACGHALASDPRMAEAYYIKAAILFGQGQVEHGRLVVPPGATEALNKYLEYEPSGQHAAAVRDKLNRPVDTNLYEQKRK